MSTLGLTHTGKFSNRASALFTTIFQQNGQVELSLGLGSKGDKIGVMVALNDDFSTVFLAKEARAVIEIIRETSAEEEPYSPQVKRVFDHLATQLDDLASQAEDIQTEQINRELNRKLH